MITTITKDQYPKDWDAFLDDFEFSYQELRRGSNFYVQLLVELNEEFFPEHPELWGFWESDTVTWDSEWGLDERPATLYRVEKVTKLIEQTSWKRVA